MCPPTSSNTTQVLRRLLCQRGLGKKKQQPEFSDITCSLDSFQGRLSVDTTIPNKSSEPYA